MPNTCPPMSPEIEALEKQIWELGEKLRAARQAAPPETVQDYIFESPGGPIALSELFADRDDLFVVHNMGKRCSYCTLWADGLNGLAAPLLDRAACVISSPDDPATQQAFAKSRGWTLPMVSCKDNTFAADLGYHYPDQNNSYMPGISAFHRNADGSITRTGHTPFGPYDMYCPVWPLFSLLKGGAGDWQPKFEYGQK
ncbi:DUF899 family protein [Phycisphaeraceae bacterium D3-23]